MNVHVISLAVLLLTTSVSADESGIKEVSYSDRQIIEAEIQSKEWSITADDWLRYKKLMAGSRGIWSPDADPLIALGVHAETIEERRRLAELFVMKEYERTQGELDFQREVDVAWKRLFPNRLRVNNTTENVAQNAPIQVKYKRYALVLEAGCNKCNVILKQYINKIVQEAGLQALDIYLRQTANDDAALRQWVKSSKIPVELIQSERITINHGDQYKEGRVPVIWAQNGEGEWLKIN